MTREVQLVINGLHMSELADAEDAGREAANVETVSQAQYFKKNDSHYLLYEDMVEGAEQSSQNRIKFKNNMLEITRRGAVSTHMIFEENKKHMINYTTPYGNFLMGIDTGRVQVEETEDTIGVKVEYALEIDGEAFSDCKISITISGT